MLHSVARNAGGIRQRFLRFLSTGQPVQVRSRRCWTRAVSFAIIASLVWVTSPTAQAQSVASNDATLSELSLYAGDPFSSRGAADLMEAFMNALIPQLDDRITLIPAFTQGVKSYTVTIRYDVTCGSTPI